ncbi:MAG TPA: hypothetical protein DGP89_05520 [Saprospirales bacterium]|jgi:Mlc titration factor MtfA (ptsG expression regulator)|nr:hypothetical protein [Saprospirales bacterium]
MIWILFPLVIATAVVIFQGQIDFWWNERNPVPLDPPISDWLKKYDPYYTSLDPNQRQNYDNRLVMYMQGRAFVSVGREHHDVPNDIQAIIASNAVKMLMSKKDYLLGDMDRIYLYKHPFPTPRHQFLHTVETDIEDGVFIFSLEHLVPGMINPKEHYNIAMHGFAEAFQRVFPKEDFTYLDQITWDQIEEVGYHSKDKILKTIGFNQTDTTTVAINHFFTHPRRFNLMIPAAYERLIRQFGADQLSKL